MPAPDFGDEMTTWVWQITSQGVRDLAQQGSQGLLRQSLGSYGSIRGIADQSVLLKEARSASSSRAPSRP